MAINRPTDPPASAAIETPPVPLGAGKPSAAYMQVGYLFAAAGALLFSTKAIFIKLAYQDPVDAETLLALRMLFSMPFYAVIGALSVRDRRRAGEALPGRGLVLRALLVGALGYWVASYSDFLGLEYISAQFERLILFTYPLFVVIFGAMFFGQPIRFRAVAAIGVSYLGLAVIFGEKLTTLGPDVAIGAGLVLAAAVAFALYQLLAKQLIAPIGPRLFTCIAMSGAAAGALIQFFLTHPAGDLLVGHRVVFLAIAIAIGATVLPSFFLNAALHRISAQANATIGTLSPVMTIALAVLILGEELTLVDVLGSALVLVGVGWFTLAERRK